MRTARLRQGPSGPFEEVEIPESSTDIANASSVPGATVTAALNELAGVPVAMWILGNDFGFPLFGWTAEHIATSYAGAPDVVINLDELGVGVGHGHAILADGSHVIATSEDDGGNLNESFFWVPGELVRSSRALTYPPLIRMRCGEIVDAAAHTGARWVVQLGTGEVVMGREYYALLATQGQARGQPDFRAAVVTTTAPGVLSSDAAVDGEQRVWTGAGNRVQGVPRSALLAGGAQAADKVMQGSNVSASADPNTGAGSFGFDATGAFWLLDSNSNEIKIWDAAAVAALTGVASNPAPTRMLTSPALVGDLWGAAMDVDGGLWVADYKETGGSAYHFSAAQYAAGGSQVPDRQLSGLPPYALTIRFSPGYGLFLR